MKFLVGLIFIAMGAAIIHYRFQIYEFTGEWGWANTYVGNTANAIVLVGMLCIGIGAAYPFGAFDRFSATGNLNTNTTSTLR